MRVSKRSSRKQYNKPCIYCRRLVYKPGSAEALDDPGLEFSEEHYVPRCRGGSNELENLKISCRRCNNIKGNMMPEVFDPFARIVLTQYPSAPTPVLKDALKQYVMSLAEIAVRNNSETKKALLVTLIHMDAMMKGR